MSALVQNTPEWEAMRRNKIGASDAPVIMGVSPWTTPYQLWEQKLQLTPERKKTPAMLRGHQLEENARQEFERLTGLIVFPQVVQHPDYEWMIASLDGVDVSGRNIVELKCTGHEDHATAVAGMVPDKYMPQLQHQIEVCEVEKITYFSYYPHAVGVDTALIEVYRDDKYISDMVKKEKSFWLCMQNLEAPTMTEKDYLERDDDLWTAASQEWIGCHKLLESLKAKEEDLRVTLIALAGRSNSKGAGIRLSRIIRKGAIDYKAIPEIQELNLEYYRKPPVETWRLTADG